MAGAILHENLVAWGVGLGVFNAAEGAISCLLSPQPSDRARWLGSAATILIDFGGLRAIDCVAILSTTLGAWGALGVVRVRLSAADATGVAGEIWDTTAILAETSTDYQGNIILVRTAGPVSGRYLLVEVLDGAAPLVDIGLVAAGALWRMSQAPSYGFAEGRITLDVRTRNPLTGTEHPVPARLNPRAAAWQNDLLSRAEGTGQLRTIAARNGAVKDVLWIPEIKLSQAELNARSLWGAVAKSGDLAGAKRVAYPGWTRAWELAERG